ncbi:MAG: hypothetical protein AB7H77_06985 [Bdellovibrionales bacterium]
MPAVVPAVIAGAIAATSVTAPLLTITAAGAFTGGLSFAFSWGTFALVAGGTFALGQLSKALGPKPPKIKGSDLGNQVAQQTLNFRRAITDHMLVYGQTRVGGPVALDASSQDNEYFHRIILLAAHEVDSIDEIWVEGYCIPNDWIDADGNVTQGRYAGYLRIRKHLGSPLQSADSALVAEVPEWTADHRLQGIAYVYFRLKFNQDVWTQGIPTFTAVVKGRKVTDPRTGVTRWSPNTALFYYSYMMDAVYGPAALAIDFEETSITAAANVADEIVDVNDKDTQATSVDDTTNIITLTGDMLQYQLGDRVELVTAGTPPGGTSTGTDYYVIPYQFKDTPRIRLAASLDDAISGTAVEFSSAGSGTLTVRQTGEPRYHGAGVVDTGKIIQDNIEDILSGMSARAFYAGGKWRLKPAIWVAPTLTLDEGDMVGAISMQSKQSRRDRFNVVKGIYVSSVNNWQATDYPQQTDSNYLEEDGIAIPKPLDLPFTNRAAAAQRMALVELRRSRQEITATIPFSLKALQLQCGDNVLINLARLGWEEKPFEIATFDMTAEAGDNPRLVVSLGLRETAEAAFDWSPDLQTDIDPAPNTNLPNPFNVTPPSNVVFNSRVVSATNSGSETVSVYNLSLQWDSHPNAFVREGGFFRLQLKESAEVAWRPSFEVDGALTAADLLTTSVNTPYDLRIQAVNNLGIESNFVTIENVVIGSSGPIGSSEDWEDFSGAPGSSEDWEDFSGAPGSSEDWEFFT